ncbi:MAG: ubiquinone/menaquinone biosynthesis methyltransferase, partial [Actinobacteria bacterium]|nr:ubiquinone/menaquinone biosynthesis methyltransferase [Actinomycetota bacterium]
EKGDLIMMGIGGFSPLTGFMGKADWKSVCEKFSLTDGTFWPIPVILATDDASVKAGDEIALVRNGTVMATMKVTEKFELSEDEKKFECEKNYKGEGADSQTEMLDLAAGTGDVTFAIAKRTPPASIMSTDFCDAMLDVARKRYAQGEAGAVPCEFEVVDAQDIPFASNSFDLVTCAYGVRNIPDRMKAFSEAYRVLKSGGRYVILEFSTPPNAAWRTVYHIYLRNVIPFVGGLLTGDRQGFVYLNDSIRAFPDQETLAGYLKQVGFKEVHYENQTGGIVAIHVANK